MKVLSKLNLAKNNTVKKTVTVSDCTLLRYRLKNHI